MKHENKPWRISRKNFYNKLDLFLDKRLNELIDNIQSIELIDRTSYMKRLLSKAKKVKKVSVSINDTKGKMNSRKEKVRIISQDIKDWENFSMNMESADDIVFRLIIQEKFKVDLCCLGYICKYSVLSEDLIDDIIFITSGLFSFSKWDDTHVHSVVKCLEKDNFEDEEFKALYPFVKTNKLSERIDWYEIYMNQKISDEFKKSHSQFFQRTAKLNFKFKDEENTQ